MPSLWSPGPFQTKDVERGGMPLPVTQRCLPCLHHPSGNSTAGNYFSALFIQKNEHLFPTSPFLRILRVLLCRVTWGGYSFTSASTHPSSHSTTYSFSYLPAYSSIHPLFCLNTHLSTCSPKDISTHSSTHPAIYSVTTHHSTHPSVHPSTCLPIY